MATIELSSQYLNGLTGSPTSGFCHRMMTAVDYNSAISIRGFWCADTSAFPPVIRIMKGTVPTDFSTLTTPSSRSADILYQVYGSETSYWNLTTGVNPIVFNTYLKAATGTGTATWFWMLAQNRYGTIANQLLGTVGLNGSGADLEIADVNIVSGTQYKIVDLKIQFPSVWTY
jgi:hypothetical protein